MGEQPSQSGTAHVTAQELQPRPFGRYLLLDLLAMGGMGEVWRAKQRGLSDFQKLVAIKKLRAELVEDPTALRMFRDEARLTVQLQHANIGQVYELNREAGEYFIAMEYISGKDAKSLWNKRRQRGGSLATPLACLIILEVCEALDFAHSKADVSGVPLGIIHRDVNPQNILIGWNGQVKLVDFGIARSVHHQHAPQDGTISLAGKVGYLSPEQVQGMPLDHRSDLFSLGLCLYEFTTGQRAFPMDPGLPMAEQLRMIRDVEVTRPSKLAGGFPAELEGIILRALEAKPSHRYGSGEEMAMDLRHFLLNSTGQARGADLAQYLSLTFPGEREREQAMLQRLALIDAPEEPAAPRTPSWSAAPVQAPSTAEVELDVEVDEVPPPPSSTSASGSRLSRMWAAAKETITGRKSTAVAESTAEPVALQPQGETAVVDPAIHGIELVRELERSLLERLEEERQDPGHRLAWLGELGAVDVEVLRTQPAALRLREWLAGAGPPVTLSLLGAWLCPSCALVPPSLCAFIQDMLSVSSVHSRHVHALGELAPALLGQDPAGSTLHSRFHAAEDWVVAGRGTISLSSAGHHRVAELVHHHPPRGGTST